MVVTATYKEPATRSDSFDLFSVLAGHIERGVRIIEASRPEPYKLVTYDSRQPMPVIGHQIKQAIEKYPDAAELDVYAHSLGVDGVVEAVLQGLRVHRVITMAGPWEGTKPRIFDYLKGDEEKIAERFPVVRDIRPDSEYITERNRRIEDDPEALLAMLDANFFSVDGSDKMIDPAEKGHIPYAKRNVGLTETSHWDYVSDISVWRIIYDEVKPHRKRVFVPGFAELPSIAVRDYNQFARLWLPQRIANSISFYWMHQYFQARDIEEAIIYNPFKQEETEETKSKPELRLVA